MAAIIPGPVGVIAGLCDIGLSYATGDYGAISDTILNCLIMRGMGGLIVNFCKLPKFAKYLVGGVLFKFGVDNISKAKDQIENAANMLVDLMEQGGDIFSYVHAISEMTQGIGFLCGSVKFTTDVSVGMYRQCFVAGTKVKTEDGDKNIEEIEAGDRVWSYDPVTGEEGLKEVKQTFENETETLVHVTVSNENDKETIDTTVRHPFYVVGYGFRYASELRIGDKVRSVGGDIYEVTSVEIEQLDEPVKIYNFEVEDWHTYFVSESGILVHNTNGGPSCDAVASNENGNTTTSEGGSGAVSWSNHGYKHFPNKNQSWKDIVKSTKSGPAKYSLDIQDIEAFERAAWENGIPVTNGKNWRVNKYDTTIGAVNEKETVYVRIENSSNTIHGHPISESEYNKLLKEY